MDATPFHRKAFPSLSEFLLHTGTWIKPYSQKKYSKSRFVEDHDHQGSVTDKSLMFHVEAVLLRSTSLFAYFFLVAFEGGGPLRALLLLLLYPIVCLVGNDMGIKVMVFVCFAGMKEKAFRVGTSVLPKFLLEDVGSEGFEMVAKFGRKIAVSQMPRVMVECLLRDYLGVDGVIGRELKVVRGRFSGLMEEKHTGFTGASSFDVGLIGNFVSNSNGAPHSHQHLIFSHSKAMYLVSEADKRNWETLPRQKYLKPLVFHDGRVAFRPTPLTVGLVKNVGSSPPHQPAHHGRIS